MIDLRNPLATNVKTGGIESSGNSSTTLLVASATFTGTAELNNYPDVMIYISTDQNGTYYIEFSSDGTNWDTSLSFLYDTTRINAPHTFDKAPRYFRIRFTNTSTTDQTYLRLLTYYGSFNQLTAPINGTLSENYDATVVRPTDYKSEVAMGKRQGRTLWNKFGYNQDVDVGTEVIASFGGTWIPMTTAATLRVSSTSVNDTDGGSGTNSIVIYGIDADRNAITEVVTMGGTSIQVTTNTWLGVNRVVMFLCGTGQINAGNINVTASGTFSSVAQMPAGGGVTQQCIFHVPVNHTFLTEWLYINVLNQNKDAELTVKLWVYSAVNNGKQEVFRVDIDTQKDNEINIAPKLPFPISEQSVMWMECTSDKANIIINARFDGILERIS